MERMKPENITELKASIVKVWEGFSEKETKKEIEKACESWVKRVRKCIECGGDRFEFKL